MERRLAFLLAAVVWLSGCTGHNCGSPEARAAKLFSEWDSPASPGCAVAVIQNGRFLMERGFGSANIARKVPIGPDTAFNLASMSKQFTGMAVAMLVQDRKLTLDDDVRRYIPEIPNYGETVRIRDLVHHRSGLRDYISLAEDLSDFGRLDRPHSETDFLGLLARQKALNFAPSTRFSYNNSNYFLLGIVVKRVAHMSLREFAEERIFRPLGMRQTRFADNYSAAVPDRAVGYDGSGHGRFIPVESYFDQVGDGGVVTTLNDLARWDAEFYNHSLGGPNLHNRLVTTGMLNDGTPLNYAFGLYHDSTALGPRIYHGGNDAGFRTRMVRYPSQRLSIYCLCNLSSINTGRIVDKLASIYLGNGATAHSVEIPVPAEELTRVQGYYRDPSTMGIWNFRRAGGHLAATLVGIPGEKTLIPIGNGAFGTEDGSFVATFDPAAETVQVSEYHTPPTAFSRVQLAKPRDSNEYAGTYSSDELPDPFRIEVLKGELSVTSPKAAAGTLSPTVTDAFTGDGNYFLFHRDGKGAITGFRLGENTGRVRNIEFQRATAR